MELSKFNLIYEMYVAGITLGYEINTTTFIPFKYNNTFIAATALNNEKDHALNRFLIRINKRAKELKLEKIYTLTDLLEITKEGVYNFFKNNYETLFKKLSNNYEKRVISCVFISKNNPIKICTTIEINKVYDILNTTKQQILKDFYSSKYLCFIYTALTDLQEPNKNNLKIPILENIIHTKIINIEIS